MGLNRLNYNFYGWDAAIGDVDSLEMSFLT